MNIENSLTINRKAAQSKMMVIASHEYKKITPSRKNFLSIIFRNKMIIQY